MILKFSEAGDIFRLEAKRLGRPYHRLPEIFNDKFDVIESRLGHWFLKNHRASLNLKKVTFQMDVGNKTAELLSSPLGNLGFDIDRNLLLTLLNNFYGLDVSADPELDKNVLTKTEQRLKARIASGIITLLFNEDTLNLPLPVKSNNNGVQTRWAYQATFSLSEEPGNTFCLLLDDAHTDYMLNLLRQNEKNPQSETAVGLYSHADSLENAIATLPLTLQVRVAEISMDVASLTTLRPGDILPIALGSTFPVTIGKSTLFNAVIVEEQDRLLLADIKESVAEKTYD